MRALAVFGGVGRHTRADVGEVAVDGAVVRHAVLNLKPPALDACGPGLVLLRVDAFSCNYRDKGFLDRMRRAPAADYFVIGSEFCGTVLEVGADVRGLRPGDRVIGQNAYRGMAPGDGAPEVQGLATNHGSREYLRLPAEALARTPDRMSAERAASFSVGAQTAYSMIRRAELGPGDHVLVTSATSNTSLFLIRALAACGARITATTSAAHAAERLRALGVERVVLAGGGHPAFHESEAVLAAARDVGGFHAAFDAFFDLHVARAVATLRPFGRYVTCGLSAQTEGARARAAAAGADLRRIMIGAMLNNVTLIGNCLGTRADLERALRDYDEGRLDVSIDSVYDETDATGFLDRTYNAPDRFGKVVCRYRQ